MAISIKSTNILTALIAGAAGGILVGGLLMPVLIKKDVAGLGKLSAFISGSETIISRVEEKIIVVPEGNYFQQALEKINPSLVAVQSFSAGRVVRFGSGIVLTRDGLIATLGSVVPSGADYYQVWINGQPSRARVVRRDLSSGLTLVKSGADNLGVAVFRSEAPPAASSLIMAGKIVNLNNVSVLIEPVFVTLSDQGKFNFKADYNESLFGAALINSEGRVFGIIDFKNKSPRLIASDAVEAVMGSYLEGGARP